MPLLTDDQVREFHKAKQNAMRMRWAAICAVIVAALLLWRSCSGESEAAVYSAIKERLEARIKDSARVNDELAKERKTSRMLEFSVADLQSKYVISTRALQDESRTSERLRADVRKAKANKDTVQYYVHCDSLVEVTEQSERHRQAALRQAAMIDSMRIAQLKSKDREIGILQAAHDSCIDAIVFANNKLPQLKPRGKVYFDITGMVGAVTAAGGGIGYMDKNGKMLNLDVLISAHGTIYQLRATAPLSFKRKK